MGMGVALFFINFCDQLVQFLLPNLPTLWSPCLEVLVPEGGIIPPGDNNYIIELEIKIATGTLWAPHATQSTDKEESYFVVCEIGLAYEGEIGLATAQQR